ncbi:MAG: S41 family peptidase [bacterium]
MKTSTNLPFIVFIFISLLLMSSCRQPNGLSGTWKGKFMNQFDIQIVFQEEGGKTTTGVLLMFDGGQKIQHDALTRIRQKGDHLSFYIAAKETPFEGTITGDVIKGNFTFPDGSVHPLTVSRMTNDGKNAERTGEPGKYTRAELKADLIFTKEKLEALHPSLYRYQTREDFDKGFEHATGSLDEEMDILEFYRVLAPCVHKIGCSHTGVRLPENIRSLIHKERVFFPFRIAYCEEKAVIAQPIAEYPELPPGDEILSINGKGIDIIGREIFELIPSEGNRLSTKYFWINRSFPQYYMFLDGGENYEVSLENGMGKTESILVQPVHWEQAVKNYPFMEEKPPAPMPVTYRLMEEPRAGILTISSFGIADMSQYMNLLDSVFGSLKDSGIHHLVIDLRGNSGGHPIFAAQLLSYLADEPFVYFDSTNRIDEFAPLYLPMPPNDLHFNGEVYVLSDGGCLSTAGHLLSLLKYHGLATIVGEEPGSSYRCNDMSRQFTLPNSGIELNVPTAIFQTAVHDFSDSTHIIDIPVDCQKTAFSNDAAMERTRELMDLSMVQHRTE